MNDALARERYLKTGMGKRYLKNRMKRFLSLTGQALLELAIFGSILIMLLGVLISYGLRYSSQQRVMQLAFRRALRSAAESVQDGKPTAASYMILTDKHISSPSDPFGIGSVTPIVASAGVTRNYRMHETADNVNELPQVTVDVQGQAVPFKAAGIRYEYNVDPANLDKYNEIYYATNVKATDSDVVLDDEVINPETGEVTYTYYKNLQIIDSCAGEVIDYGTAVRQCRQIVDPAVCQRECERAKVPGSTTDCNDICSQVMNAPNQNNNGYDSAKGGAWYCAHYTVVDNTGGPENHKYIFPVLYDPAHNAGLFAFAHTINKPMGLQQDYHQTATKDGSLHKTESHSAINDTDTWNWQVQTTRNIVYRAYDDTSGNIALPQEVTSNVSQNQTYNWPEAKQ